MRVGQTLVYHDDSFKVFWSGSTFNVFDRTQEVDCFTVYNVTNSSDAIWHAREYMDNLYKEVFEDAN